MARNTRRFIDILPGFTGRPDDNAFNVILENVSSPLPNYSRVTVICAAVQ